MRYISIIIIGNNCDFSPPLFPSMRAIWLEVSHDERKSIRQGLALKTNFSENALGLMSHVPWNVTVSYRYCYNYNLLDLSIGNKDKGLYCLYMI